MTKGDIASGMRLKELAGWNQTSADWERFLEVSPQGCFVAESQGEVWGTVTTIIYEDHFAWVGMVLVDPGHRSQGVGTQLLHKAIEYLDGQGVATIKLDATPQGQPIYEKLGFVPEYEIERYALSARGQLSKPGSEYGQQNSESVNLEEILAMDSNAFGADRSALLLSLHRSAPEFTAAVYLQGSLAGYTLGRRGSQADQMGPWMATSKAAAHQLLVTFHARSARETIFVDCMKASPFVVALLQSAGFEFSRPLTRMYRGDNKFPGRPELFCGILGPEFG